MKITEQQKTKAHGTKAESKWNQNNTYNRWLMREWEADEKVSGEEEQVM